MALKHPHYLHYLLSIYLASTVLYRKWATCSEISCFTVFILIVAHCAETKPYPCATNRAHCRAWKYLHFHFWSIKISQLLRKLWPFNPTLFFTTISEVINGCTNINGFCVKTSHQICIICIIHLLRMHRRWFSIF
jgi:hypothetical protein